VVIAGIISALVPDDFFIRYLDNEFLSLGLMLVVGIPLYICASASTPIAAALVLKGLAPGAALVFLLAGPATNAATITVISRFFGRKAMFVYLASIALCSLVMGWLTNLAYASFAFDVTLWGAASTQSGESPLMQVAALVLVLLIAKNMTFFKRRAC
jgi:uncharacterized membrane protein YraQ (UPF0718 family)